MKLERLRQSLQPLFGVERRETAARFLYAILISGLIVEALMFGFRTLSGDTIFVSTGTRLLIGRGDPAPPRCRFGSRCASAAGPGRA